MTDAISSHWHWALAAVKASAKLAFAVDCGSQCELANGVPCGPQYPQEAREDFGRQYHEYKEHRRVLLDEVRTARLMARASGRRVARLYALDLDHARRDMVLERARFWRMARGA